MKKIFIGLCIILLMVSFSGIAGACTTEGSGGGSYSGGGGGGGTGGGYGGGGTGGGYGGGGTGGGGGCNSVPIPASIFLLAPALFGVVGISRKRKTA